MVSFFLIAACSSSSPDVITSEENSIQTPFHPDYYANNQDCKWLIIAPEHKIIRFWFTHFKMVQPDDYLEIRDGVNDTSPMIRNFTTKPDMDERWTTSGRHLFARFRSDKSIVAEGFNMVYKYVNQPKGTPKLSCILQSCMDKSC